MNTSVISNVNVLRTVTHSLFYAALALAPLGCGDGAAVKADGPTGEISDGSAEVGEAGSVRRDYWAGLPDGDPYVANLRDKTAKSVPPTITDKLTSLQTQGFDGDTSAVDYASDFGERIRGFIKAPESGVYRVLVSGDNQVQFYLSTDDKNDAIAAAITECKNVARGEPCPAATAENKDHTLRTSFMEAAQTSKPISLVAGSYYFFDWYHREGQGRTHALVKWAKPGQTATDTESLEIIPESVLYYPERFKTTTSPQASGVASR